MDAFYEEDERIVTITAKTASVYAASRSAVSFSSRPLLTVPILPLERALRFYADRVGFTLDVDYSPTIPRKDVP